MNLTMLWLTHRKEVEARQAFTLAAMHASYTIVKNNSALFILFLTIFLNACNNEIIDRTADFNINTTDKESNEITLKVAARYRLTSRHDTSLTKQYGTGYKDSLWSGTIHQISSETLAEYSAGEIYNYKRNEIEQKLHGKATAIFKLFDIELTHFSIRSVELSDSLMQTLKKEHIERLKN